MALALGLPLPPRWCCSGRWEARLVTAADWPELTHSFYIAFVNLGLVFVVDFYKIKNYKRGIA